MGRQRRAPHRRCPKRPPAHPGTAVSGSRGTQEYWEGYSEGYSEGDSEGDWDGCYRRSTKNPDLQLSGRRVDVVQFRRVLLLRQPRLREYSEYPCECSEYPCEYSQYPQ